MPRNGSGQYNPLTNTWNPPVTGVLATGADFQAQLNDISAAITQSVSKDGQTPMSASLPMGNNSILGIASGTVTSPSISANGDTNTGLYFPAADTVGIAVGGVNVGNFTSAGFSGNSATATNATNLVNGNATLSAGTAAAPSLTTTGDTNTGFYFPAADTVGITTGGTQQVVVNPAGNLGIGTGSPTSKLHVAGTIRVESGNNPWFVAGAGTTGASVGSYYKGGTSTAVGYIGTDGGGIVSSESGNNFGIRAENALLFMAGAVEAGRFVNSGNLGIGTVVPAQKLEVRGTVRAGLQSSSINGTVLLDDSYGNAESLVSVNTLRSSGGLLLGNCVMQQENSANIVSTSNINLAKAGLFIENGALVFKNAAATIVQRGAPVSLNTQAAITAEGLLQFNSGYGSVATAYGCRAWVNFNGTGTVAIRASGNVSSITDNNIGDYTVNFTTAMPDANYAAQVTAGDGSVATATIAQGPFLTAPTVSNWRFVTTSSSFAGKDSTYVNASFFR